MAKQNKIQPCTTYEFRNLLFFLLLYIIGSPFLAPYPSLAVIAHISLSMVLFMSVYAVNKQKKRRRALAIILLFPLLILYWMGFYNIIPFSRFAAYLLFTIYYGFLIYSFILQIKSAKRVSLNVLYTTFSLYLIIGLFWGSLYSLLYKLSPGAYGGILLENVQNTSHIFNYFSFSTLTTLGYGDITPQTPGATSLCQMEAIIGQFFTAVVVAWLMGMFISDNRKINRNND